MDTEQQLNYDAMASSKASVDSLLDAIQVRRSIYSLTKESTIPDTRIKEIVEAAVKHCPSAFNVQSARAVILLREDHEKLWDIGDSMLKKSMPEAAYNGLAPKVAGFKGGYGSVLWFEDQESLDVLKQKNNAIQHVVPEWSDHSSGMNQFVVWTAFSMEGMGCNLQHYNFIPEFVDEVLDAWKLPRTWKLKAQLVFGKPKDGKMERRHERTYKPLDERVMVIGGS